MRGASLAVRGTHLEQLIGARHAADVACLAGRILAFMALTVASSACRMVVVHEPSPVSWPVERTSYADVVSNVAPSVVSVQTQRRLTEKELEVLSKDPAVKRSLETKGQSSSNDLPHELEGLGSGVVVSSNGYILTSAHVIDKASQIKVTLPSGEELKARVIGTDQPTDIAVLKVQARNLPVVRLADSNLLRVGDVVLALGNPLGVGQTVTSGIVSATQRTGLGLTDYEDFIQTDAPLNPGNSGGALVDARGYLVGVSIAILTTGGGFEGIGLAVPINLARNVMGQLIARGKVIRGYLGVSLLPLPPELARAFRVPPTKGALVVDLAPDSPAAKAGLHNGDVVLELDSKPVESSQALRLQIAENSPGTCVHLKVRRSGGEKVLAATLTQMPELPHLEPVVDR